MKSNIQLKHSNYAAFSFLHGCAVNNLGLMLLYNWNEEHEVDAFLNMTKLFIEDQDAFATKIDFVHFYGKAINSKDGIKWVADFMKANYPNYKVEVRSDSVSFVC